MTDMAGALDRYAARFHARSGPGERPTPPRTADSPDLWSPRSTLDRCRLAGTP